MTSTKWKFVFTCKGCMAPFTEVIEAETLEQAVDKLNEMIASNQLKLKQVTLVVQMK